MTRCLRIVHETRYNYREAVTFGPHRLMMRPREGQDTRIVRGSLEVTPEAQVQWLRDIHENQIALLEMPDPARELLVRGEVDLEMRDALPTNLPPPNTSPSRSHGIRKARPRFRAHGPALKTRSSPCR